MVVEITSENSSDIKSGTWVLDFWAEWCHPCKMMKPVFHELEGEINGINFASINIDQIQILAQEFDVMSIPTFIIISDGQEKARIVGGMPKKNFQNWIEDNK